MIYRHKVTKIEFKGDEIISYKWPDGSLMTAEEHADRFPDEWEVLPEPAKIDPHELFETASRLAMAFASAGIKPDIELCKEKALELIKLKYETN